MSKPKVLKANEDVLNQIHSLVANNILKRLESGEVDASDIALAIKFLKDNNVQAELEFNSTVKQIQNEVVEVKKLPFPVKQTEQ